MKIIHKVRVKIIEQTPDRIIFETVPLIIERNDKAQYNKESVNKNWIVIVTDMGEIYN